MLPEYLIGEHIVEPAGPPARTALDEPLDAYHDWLIADLGLAAATLLRYENTARRSWVNAALVAATWTWVR